MTPIREDVIVTVHSIPLSSLSLRQIARKSVVQREATATDTETESIERKELQGKSIKGNASSLSLSLPSVKNPQLTSVLIGEDDDSIIRTVKKFPQIRKPVFKSKEKRSLKSLQSILARKKILRQNLSLKTRCRKQEKKSPKSKKIEVKEEEEETNLLQNKVEISQPQEVEEKLNPEVKDTQVNQENTKDKEQEIQCKGKICKLYRK